ncbi:MAG: hypothetical protein HY788_07765 [Deltaproteobacteria bacterium]|nr:hypothetical protein [Deltaproteobacteria bacterium]
MTLEESERLFLCGFCRVKLLITTPDYFRTYLPPPDPSPDKVFYVPYWRFKGMRFACKGQKIEHRIIDMSRSATHLGNLPLSLGFRPQVLNLRFVSPRTPGVFLRPDRSFEHVLSQLESPSGDPSVNEPVLHQQFVGESLGMVYAPVYFEQNRLYDAVCGSPLSPADDAMQVAFESAEAKMQWQTGFLPALCPRCGWDLSGEMDSHVLLCRHCNSVWTTSGGELEQVQFAVWPAREPGSVFLPFWMIEPRIEGIRLASYADLVRTLNLPKVAQSEWESIRFRFWAPAFKVHPVLFLRLCRHLTGVQPVRKFERGLPDAPMVPATLPLKEAGDVRKIVLADLTVAKKSIFPLLPEIHTRLQRAALVFVPFEPRGNELYQAESLVSLSRSAIRIGRNI